MSVRPTVRTLTTNGELFISRDSLISFLYLSCENFGYGVTGNASRDTLVALAKSLRELK